jgi:RNA polymerase sigma-70 factor (ECF subfamily)
MPGGRPVVAAGRPPTSGTARVRPEVLQVDRSLGIGAGVTDDGFTAFFQDAYPRIVGQLRLLTGNAAGAEDVAQEAFTRSASRWRQLARYDQPEAWVRRTAFRLAVDQLRRARRQRGLLARLGTRRQPDVEQSPQDRAVIEALLRLPLPMREVLVLHHCFDLPVEAVAAQTGVSVGTVKSRLARGRERLATLLHPDPPDEAPASQPVPAPEEDRHARP